MSDHDPGYDAVEQLFARERAQVTALPGDDQRWQRIAHRAREGRRAPRWRYAGAAAAVGLVAGVVWAATAGTRVVTPPLTSPVATHPAGRTAGPRPSGPPAATVPTGTVPGYGSPVPRDLAVVSLSNAGHGWLYALGVAGCRAAHARDWLCPVLTFSSDNGRTWHTAHRFADAAVGTDAGATPPGRSAPPATALGQVRFASPQVGWVFGGGAWQTRDGGRSWQPYPHAGDAVVALETDGAQVVVVTGERCGASACSGQLTLAIDSVDQPHGVAGGGTSVDLGANWTDPVLALGGGQPLVSVWTPAGGVLLQVQDTEALSPGSQGPVCRGGGAEVVTATASAPPVLVGLCTTEGAAGSLAYAVSTSPDGRAWSIVSADALTLADAGHVAIAAADRADLLAVSGGSPSLHGSMKVSHDGGRTWQLPALAPPVPESGWQWVGAPGGRTFYALAGDRPGYWVSTDLGEHWRAVTIR